jgi:hypothetical protein
METKRVRVNVTQRDIDRGEPQECERCPIARAAKRAGIVNAKVMEGWLDVQYFPPSGECGVTLPDPAMRFIEEFDRNCGVAPFAFELDVPVAWLAEPPATT